MRELKSQLKQMKTAGQWNASRVWAEKNRERLLGAIRAEQPARQQTAFIDKLSAAFSIFVPHSVATAARPVMSMLGIGLLAIGGWIASVSASYNSIPGDVLYNVKIAAEKTQAVVVGVTGSGEAKAQMHLEFATRRAHEVKQVVAQQKSELAAETIESLKKSITVAGDTVKDVQKDSGTTGAVALAKNVNDKSGEIVSTLNQVLKDTTASGDIALTKEVVAAAKVVNETSIAVVEVAVESVVHKTPGVDTVVQEGKNLEDVKNLVADKLQTIAQEQKVAGDAVAGVVTTVSNPTGAIPVISIVTSTTSTIITTTTTTPSVQIGQAVQKAAENTETAKGVIQEAKTLVEKNQLLEAIVKVKEANEATQEVKKAVVEVQQAVKDVKDTLVADAAKTPVATTTTMPVVLPVTTTAPITVEVKKSDVSVPVAPVIDATKK